MRKILGAILCGGASRRFGEPKGLQWLGDEPLLSRVAGRLRPQVDTLAVCPGRSEPDYRTFQLPLIADRLAGREGPMSAILGAVDWAGDRYDWIATAPCDMPFLPDDLVKRLLQAAKPDIPCYAASPAGDHYTLALWPVSRSADLHALVIDEGERALHKVLGRLDAVRCLFDDQDKVVFLNVNSKADLKAAESYLHNGLTD